MADLCIRRQHHEVLKTSCGRLRELRLLIMAQGFLFIIALVQEPTGTGRQRDRGRWARHHFNTELPPAQREKKKGDRNNRNRVRRAGPGCERMHVVPARAGLAGHVADSRCAGIRGSRQHTREHGWTCSSCSPYEHVYACLVQSQLGPE